MSEHVSKSGAPDAPHAPARPAPLRGLARTLRPHQWVKNLFVLAPLFFSKLFLEPAPIARGLAAALLFCFAAGTVYLINDLFDVEKDRRHPTKRRRPIASGELPIGARARRGRGLARPRLDRARLLRSTRASAPPSPPTSS